MFIGHIHKGHSTNSSSSHSIVYDFNRLDDTSKSDDLSEVEDMEFGWQMFVLETKEAKMKYYAAQLFESFRHIIKNDFLIIPIVCDMTGLNKEEFSFVKEEGFSPYVDHQSCWNLPINFPPKFYKQLRGMLEDPNVIILGGNDNEEYDEVKASYLNGCENIAKKILSDAERTGVDNIRKLYKKVGINLRTFIEKGNHIFDFLYFAGNPRSFDDNRHLIKEDGDYWVTFDKETGFKERFSFDLTAEKYTKASIPELVDLNVTDYCNKGCNFCYKDCNTEGKHASKEEVMHILGTLSSLGVFEVALGGGDVTEWPHLEYILEKYGRSSDNNKYYTLPNLNLTVYGAKWLYKESLVEAVKNGVYGVGVSVHNMKDLMDAVQIDMALNGILRNPSYRKVDITVQHVFETLPFEDFYDLIKASLIFKFPFLLLGYKESGRGKTNTKRYLYSDEEMSTLCNLIKNSCYRLSVDTAFAINNEDFLKELGSSRIFYELEEGKFSCYVDAVNNLIGKSSYVPTDKMVKYDPNKYDSFDATLKKSFKTF